MLHTTLVRTYSTTPFADSQILDLQMATLKAHHLGLTVPVRSSRRNIFCKSVSSDQKLGGISINNGSSWSPASWRNFPVQQQPEYPDKDAVKKALNELSSYPPLIFAGECRTLQSRLAKVAVGEAFIVQVRQCSIV